MNLLYPQSNTLYPFQLYGIRQMIKTLKSSKDSAVYLADEMGLGKSPQTIVTLNTFDFRSTLIICPAVMLSTWLKELTNWSTLKNPTIKICDSSKSLKSLRGANYAIVTYGIAAKKENAQLLSTFNFECLVLDEANAVKNYKALRTKSILSIIWPKIKYRIALSGTPITNCAIDGYTLFSKMLSSEKSFSDWFTFAETYCLKKYTPFGNHVQYYGVQNSEKLSKLIRDNFFIRRKKEEVLKDLPDKIFTTVDLPESLSYKALVKDRDALTTELERLKESLILERPLPIPSALLQGARRMQGLLKVDFASEFISEFLEQDIPLVVFTYHRDVLNSLAAKLKDYKPLIISGDTPNSERAKNIEEFQGGEGSNLFIGQIMASGVGITLTRSSTVIFVELDWSPANVSQAIARVHRITQKNCVNVYNLVVKNSLDEQIVGVIMNKVKAIEKVIDEK